MSQGENLAEILKSQWSARDIENVTRRKRLGAHSGAERCEPGAKSGRNLKKGKVSAGELTPAPQGVSREPNLAEHRKSRLHDSNQNNYKNQISA